MRTIGRWLPGPGGSPCAVWLTEPDGPIDRDVLVLPPIGYEYSSSHRFLRTVAEQLAADGARVLRLDYWGTGDSAGGMDEVTSIGPWRESVMAAAGWLRAQGASAVTVVAVQLGAMLAALDADEIGLAGLVAIAPMLSGRRFTRGLSVIGQPAPDELGGLAAGGSYFGAALLEDLKGMSAELPDTVPSLAIEMTPEVAAFLQGPAEDAVVDPGLVERIAQWIGATVVADPRPRDEVTLSEEISVAVAATGAVLTGCFVTLGPSCLAGVATTSSLSDGELLLVLLNSGSDPHTGPGRAWVELARRLAADGVDTLRVDLRGWGESPDGPSVPARPYDQHAMADVAELVDELRRRGRQVALAGLCAGAWIALETARTADLAGVVALNPQLYWRPGDPVEALMSDTRQRREPEIARIHADAQSGRWDAEDEQGLRPPAGELLDALVERGAPVAMLFAHGDDGIEYLRDRLARRLDESVGSGVVTVEELPDVDHAMHRWWFRPVVFDAVERHLRAIAAT